MRLRQQRALMRVRFEWRLAFQGIWLIPLLVAAAWWVYWAGIIVPQSTTTTAAGGPAPDLLLVARGGLEFLLPLVTPLLAESLLPTEISQHTVALLAVRTRLWAVLGIRVPLVILWVLGIACAATLAIILWRPASAIWYWGTIWASVPPALLLLAVAVLAAIALGAPRVGMLVAFAFWLANAFINMPQRAIPTSVLRWLDALSAFSATTYSPNAPIGWEASKAMHLALALGLLIVAAMTTRGLGRLVRTSNA